MGEGRGKEESKKTFDPYFLGKSLKRSIIGNKTICRLRHDALTSENSWLFQDIIVGWRHRQKNGYAGLPEERNAFLVQSCNVLPLCNKWWHIREGVGGQLIRKTMKWVQTRVFKAARFYIRPSIEYFQSLILKSMLGVLLFIACFSFVAFPSYPPPSIDVATGYVWRLLCWGIPLNEYHS